MVKGIKISDGSVKEFTADQILKQYKNLVYKLVNDKVRNLDRDETIQIGNIALYRAFIDYDISKGSNFTTFATIYIRFSLYEYYKRNNRKKRIIEKESLRLDDVGESGDEHYEIISYGKTPTEELIDKIFLEEIEEFVKTKKPKQYKIFELLKQGKGTCEIQKILGDRTHQTTSCKIQTLYKNIRKEFKSING